MAHTFSSPSSSSYSFFSSSSSCTTSSLLLLLLLSSTPSSAITCPGFPGYCSESFPGQFCNVVCDRGRNNVPLCQDDGTWTDIPRCIEHDPGVDEQVPGLCPGIPGYCAVGFLAKRCKFDCATGPDIDSVCTKDGTWSPYPTCEGDLRETQDGCDGCPGPRGMLRNRTAEALARGNIVSDRRIPKIVTGNTGGRKTVPSFAGNINIGPLDVITKPTTTKLPTTTKRPTSSPLVDRRPVQSSFRPVAQSSSGQTAPPTRETPPSGSTFGVYAQVDLKPTGQSGPSSSQVIQSVSRRPGSQGRAQPYGEFQTVSLQ